jgi:type II secretory pathway predicted ATPase ExeA
MRARDHYHLAGQRAAKMLQSFAIAVGAGKTVAVRAATAALEGSRHVVIYLPNPSVGVRGMLHHVVSALGQTPNFYTATLVPQAAAALAAEHAERGRTPIVVFDEAHLLDNAQLEAVRMLTLCRGSGYAEPLRLSPAAQP